MAGIVLSGAHDVCESESDQGPVCKDYQRLIPDDVYPESRKHIPKPEQDEHYRGRNGCDVSGIHNAPPLAGVCLYF